METPETTELQYFNWEGDACRLYRNAQGDIQADIYRGGKGVLPIEPADLFMGAKEISLEKYRLLVQEEIAIGLRNKSNE